MAGTQMKCKLCGFSLDSVTWGVLVYRLSRATVTQHLETLEMFSSGGRIQEPRVIRGPASAHLQSNPRLAGLDNGPNQEGSVAND